MEGSTKSIQLLCQNDTNESRQTRSITSEFTEQIKNAGLWDRRRRGLRERYQTKGLPRTKHFLLLLFICSLVQ